MNTFGERLKELRVEKGWTIERLAKEIHHAKSAVSYWENNQKEPTLSAIKELCFLFGVSADYLIGLEDDNGNKLYYV